MKIKHNYENAVLVIEKYASFFNDKIDQVKEGGLNEFDFYLFKTANRIKTNLNAVKIILQEYKNTPDGYLPAALILRTINSDCLTFLYIVHFIEVEKKEQISCLNELNIFNKEYVQFLHEFGVEELAYTEKYHAAWESYTTTVKDTLTKHFVNNKDYYIQMEGKNIVIPNEEIRKTSAPKFFKDEKDLKLPSGFFSEKYRYNLLKKENEDLWAGQAFLAFKYFSQFHHVSPIVLRWEGDKKETLSTMMLCFTFETLFYCSDLILVLLLKDKYFYKDEFLTVFQEMQNLLVS